jgi:hypothetical protein
MHRHTVTVAVAAIVLGCGTSNGSRGADTGSQTTIVRSQSAGYKSVSLGQNYACAVKLDGSVVCWGSNIEDESTPLAGHFSAVSGGWGAHTCGVRDDGSAVCWGQDGGGVQPPPGSFAAVSAGDFQGDCGVETDGSLVCWGSIAPIPPDSGVMDAGPLGPPLPSGRFKAVGMGVGMGCAVRTDGTLACWPNWVPSPAGSFRSVEFGLGTYCALESNGTPSCWDELSVAFPLGAPPAGTFTAIGVGDSFACGIKNDGTLACWGPGDGARLHQTDPPQGTFTSISLNGPSACAVDSGGYVVCWGFPIEDDMFHDTLPP